MKKLFVSLLIFTLLFSCLIPINVIPVSAAGITFPYNATYPYGIGSLADDQEEAAAMLQAEWNDWKSQRITSSGAGGYRRVQRDASTNFDTVSEGIGYGMLFAVYFDDRPLFDDLYSYAKAHFNANGLMGWHVDANGNFTTTDGGSGAATDADEDMGLALVFACKKWGTTGAINYETEAKTLINTIYNKEVEANSYVLKPGDVWGGASVTNPSYFAPAWYRVFAEFTGKTEWYFVINKCYEIFFNCRNYDSLTGLIPDWCMSNGKKAGSNGYDFKYDAIRVPWRISIDYCWNGITDAKVICDDISKFFRRAGVENIGDGYTITGTQLSSNHSPAFISCLSSGSMTMVGYDLDYPKALYDENIKVKDIATPEADYSYYGNSLRLFALLFTTGNFPNLYKFIPTPPPASSVSGYVDVDYAYQGSAASVIKSGFKVEIGDTGNYATTDATGYFNVTDVPNGTYTLKISKPNYLTREIGNITVNSDIQVSTYGTPVKLWAGDVVVGSAQDNAINILDIMKICKYFNTSSGDGRYDSGYDFDADGNINLTDITIVTPHFNKISANYE